MAIFVTLYAFLVADGCPGSRIQLPRPANGSRSQSCFVSLCGFGNAMCVAITAAYVDVCLHKLEFWCYCKESRRNFESAHFGRGLAFPMTSSKIKSTLKCSACIKAMDPVNDLIDTPEQQLKRQVDAVVLFFKKSRFVRRTCAALFNVPHVKQEDSYVAADKFKKTVTPTDGVDYEWVLNLARFNYDQLLASNTALDEKAEKLIAIFASGSGLLSLGAVLKLSEVNSPVALCWGGALVFGVASVIIGGLVRFPRESKLPPTVEEAMLYANIYKEAAEIRFVGQWHLVCEFLKIRNARKAYGLKLAFWCGMISVVFLLISFWIAFATIGPARTMNVKEISPMADDQKPAAPAPEPAPAAPIDPSFHIEPQPIYATPDPARYTEPQTYQESQNPEE